jgi:hypothetical protein
MLYAGHTLFGVEVGLPLSSRWQWEGMKQEKQAVLKKKKICTFVW